MDPIIAGAVAVFSIAGISFVFGVGEYFLGLGLMFAMLPILKFALPVLGFPGQWALHTGIGSCLLAIALRMAHQGKTGLAGHLMADSLHLRSRAWVASGAILAGAMSGFLDRAYLAGLMSMLLVVSGFMMIVADGHPPKPLDEPPSDREVRGAAMAGAALCAVGGRSGTFPIRMGLVLSGVSGKIAKTATFPIQALLCASAGVGYILGGMPFQMAGTIPWHMFGFVSFPLAALLAWTNIKGREKGEIVVKKWPKLRMESEAGRGMFAIALGSAVLAAFVMI